MAGGNFGHFPRRHQGKPAEDANEDEEELLEWDIPTTRDTVLWLIDAGPKMHDEMITLRAKKRGSSNDKENDQEEEERIKVSVFHQALQAAYQFQRSKLVNSPADHCGILLFNTQETDVQEAGKNVAYPNSVSVQKISQVAVPPISELKDDLQNSLDNGPSYFREKYRPAAQQSRIHYALTNAEAMMMAAGKAGSKRIFFVTNEDDPMRDKKGKTEQQRLSLEKVKSMIKRGIEFEPFLISTDEHPFETVHFFGDLFSAYSDEDDNLRHSQDGEERANYNTRVWNATTKFDHLEQEIGTRETPKRVIFSVPLVLNKDVTIGVKGYCTIVKATKGLPVRVIEMEREDEDDPVVYKEIVTQTALLCADTGRSLDKDTDIDRAFAFGNENSLRSQVRFSNAEMQKLRCFGQEPGIRILGFKPFKELHFHENIKHSYFIYPSDSPYPNSTRAFSALLQTMAKKKKMALGIFCPRRNVIPTFAALLPQMEERGEEGQIEPPGIHVIPLPYADDIREAPEKHRDQLQANKEQIDLACKIVTDYSKKSAFNPDFFPNAGLNHHYQLLLAVAFNDDIPDDLDDKTVPYYSMIKKRVGPLIQNLNQKIIDDERVLKMMTRDVMTSDKKRPADFTNEEEPDLKRRHEDGCIGTLVVDKLRAACNYYRLPKTGKKSDLVDRLDAHLNQLAKRDKH